MTADDNLADSIGALVALFLPHCSDGTTLTELKGMVVAPSKRHEAHDLFGRIRRKNLAAVKAGNLPLEAAVLLRRGLCQDPVQPQPIRCTL